MDIDWTIVAFEVLNFGVLVVLMRRFLFRPVQRALVTRREEIERDRHALEAREAAAQALRTQYEQQLREVDDQARARLDEALARARREAEDLVHQGRSEARQIIASAQEQMQLSRHHALEQLRHEVLTLASEAAARVIRNMDAPSIAEAYARRAAHGLAEELSGQPPLDAVSASTGEDADPDDITRALRSVLGPGVEVDLVVDPRIVAGVRLLARGHEVEASVSASLRHWYTHHLGPTPGHPEDSAA